MSSFTEPLSFEATEYFNKRGYRLYRTNRSFEFEYGDDKRVLVPSGYLTDLGSIPRILTPLVDRDAPWAQAFVLHDFVRAMDWDLASDLLEKALRLPFRVYDEQDNMRRATCPGWQRAGIVYGVRLRDWWLRL